MGSSILIQKWYSWSQLMKFLNYCIFSFAFSVISKIEVIWRSSRLNELVPTVTCLQKILNCQSSQKKLKKDLLFVSPSQFFMDLTVQNLSQILRFGDQWVNIVIKKNGYCYSLIFKNQCNQLSRDGFCHSSISWLISICKIWIYMLDLYFWHIKITNFRQKHKHIASWLPAYFLYRGVKNYRA